MAELEGALAQRSSELRASQACARLAGERLALLSEALPPVLPGLEALVDELAGPRAPENPRGMAAAASRTIAALKMTAEALLRGDAATAAGLPVKAAPTSLVEAVEDVVTLFWSLARAKRIDLAAYVDPTIPALVETDPEALHQALAIMMAYGLDRTAAGAVMIQATFVGEDIRIALRATDAPTEAIDAEADPSLGLLRRLVEALGGKLCAPSDGGRAQVLGFHLAAKVIAPAAEWPKLPGLSVHVEIAGAAHRSVIGRYLRAAGAAPAPPETTPALCVSDTPAAATQSRRAATVICLAPEDGAAPDIMGGALADLVLPRPLRQQDLQIALSRLAAGTSLAAPSASPLASRPKSLTATLGVSALSDLLDPKVTGEMARLTAAGKGEFVARVRRLYRENAPMAVKALIDACADRDCAAAAKAAGALKSMSGHMGARLVAESAARIESQARDLNVVNVDQAQIVHRQLLATLDVLEGYPPEASLTDAAYGADPEEQALLADLKAALKGDQLSLVYQPQFDPDGRTITGVETLVRWTHPVRGFVSPAFFVPIAERYGLISELTHWVLARAMQETAVLGDVTVSFNASAGEFADPDFVDTLAMLIARCRFDPHRLEIEVTETAVLTEEDEVRTNMGRLHDLGLKIALDDFGVGYSSLSHLRLFPFDKLKIDRAFVAGCAENVQSATLVRAVAQIGTALGMKVVAEGVETEAQHQFLRSAGVHGMQGYLFAKPEPIEALIGRLEAGTAEAALSA